MRHASESQIRAALAEYLDAEREYEIRRAAYEDSKQAYFAAGDRKRELEAKAAKLLHAERGLVTYEQLAWSAIGDRLQKAPVAREIRVEQDALPLGDAAHG